MIEYIAEVLIVIKFKFQIAITRAEIETGIFVGDPDKGLVSQIRAYTCCNSECMRCLGFGPAPSVYLLLVRFFGRLFLRQRFSRKALGTSRRSQILVARLG